MGTIASKDTRRISFDNNFAISPPIALQKSIEAENVIAFENLPPVSLIILYYCSLGVLRGLLNKLKHEFYFFIIAFMLSFKLLFFYFNIW